MERLLAAIALSSMTLTFMPVASAQGLIASSTIASRSVKPADDLLALPAAPTGKSTTLGGAIQAIDPVRDQLSLKVFGEKPMKILFDERTQVYRDGVKVPLRTLGTEDHASVQTVLDGTKVFALSIHILSQAPKGECQCQVIGFDPETGELTLTSSLSPDPLKLLVSPNTPVTRVGQPTFTAAASGRSDLAKGVLVSVKFEPNKQGKGVADQIDILAMPGSEFVFSGNISSLDMHAGMLVLIDPRDEKSYQISFNSAQIPSSQNLHLNNHVRVMASYDGMHYIASSITVY